MRPRDTTREALDAQRAAWRRLGPARRVELAFEMSEQAREISIRGALAGLARIALTTSDLDADVAELEAADVELLSPPARLAGPGGSGSRFVCFKDPDGTVLELVELEMRRSSG